MQELLVPKQQHEQQHEQQKKRGEAEAEAQRQQQQSVLDQVRYVLWFTRVSRFTRKRPLVKKCDCSPDMIGSGVIVVRVYKVHKEKAFSQEV
jgi:hypothetical protein